MEEIHIEYGMPTVDVAMPLLTERLRSLKKSGVKVVKVIHGDGSTGKGGSLRKATLALLDELKKSGLIKEFVVGEFRSEVGRQGCEGHPRRRLNRQGRKPSEGHSCTTRRVEEERVDKGIRCRRIVVEVNYEP